jgi:hypothetical protein
MPALVELSRVVPALTDSLVGLIVADGFTGLGVEPRVWTYDQIPEQPVEPYLCTQFAATGRWDTTLTIAGTSGWVGLQLTGVGRLEEAAQWALDVGRSYLAALVAATVVVAGDTHVKTVTSQGPPVGPIEAGTLVNMVETYDVYVEAS